MSYNTRQYKSRSSKIMSMVQSTSSRPTQNTDIVEVPISTASITNQNYSLTSPESDNDLDFDSDDSLFDKDYVPSSLELIEHSDSSMDVIPNSQPINVTIQESPEVSSEDERITPQNLTKKGEIRKRKKYDQSPAQRKEMKKLKDMESKYNLKPGCTDTCKKKCHTHFNETERVNINRHFRHMTWKEQQYFIINNTSKQQPKRNTVMQNRKLNRDMSVTYLLQNNIGTKISVCKVFFLETLGYNRKNDKSVRNALSVTARDPVPVDRRGTNPNPNKIDDTKIIEHINSFNPSISHYRREHAPNRKYLPSDLTVTAMYEDFCLKLNMNHLPAGDQISYDCYRKILKRLNISFTKLGNEECEICERYIFHNPEYKEKRHRNCQKCRDYEEHCVNFMSARLEYQKDVQEQNNANFNSDTGYFAADLEKVIMLPRMDQFKIVMFCPRVIVFNESFVPIGDKKNTNCKIYAAIWHEAISGRKVHDITSCFKAFLTANRDLKNIVIWLDNCAAQNKNWTLYSYLVYAVNSTDFNFITIKLKYLEVGYTHMAADNFHHQVELSMKKKADL